jgi:hypothetical protein
MAEAGGEYITGLDMMITIHQSHYGTHPMDLFASRSPRYSEHANKIKAQVTSQLGLAEDAIVMVTELACLEEDCPPVETIIAVFQPAMQKFQFKFHRSMAEITAQDIQEMCEKQKNQALERNHGSCCS